MKKVLWLGIILSFLFASHTFAAYTFNLQTNGNTIAATLNGVAADNPDSFQLLLQTTPFAATGNPAVSNNNLGGSSVDPTIQKVTIQGTVVWSVPETANTTYYARVAEIPSTLSAGKSPTYITSQQTIQTAFFYSHLTTTLQGNFIKIYGAIDPVKQPNYAQYTETLTYSTSADLSSPINSNIPSALDSTKPGSYYWLIPVNSNTTYYAQQTITLSTSKPPLQVVDPTITKFDGATGATFDGGASSAGQKLLNTQSYTLLSGFPGFTVLPDPTLCARERAAGQTPQFCDLNDVINYFMKLLIGLSGVVLVVRIIYEGFVILTSDLPFKVASAKSALFTALLGLLLALSAYLILNTINPKLVTENVGLQQLSIGITEPDTDLTPIISNNGAPTSGTAGACTAGLTSVSVQKSTFTACSTYNGIPIASNLKSMLTAAYAANIVLQGGGFRTQSQQIQLRKQNCGGDTTSPSANCQPPTAVPGHSNHESGLAFDFTCNNPTATIKSQSSPCFIWLSQNAATYGFKNFAKEPWHWSWDGR